MILAQGKITRGGNAAACANCTTYLGLSDYNKATQYLVKYGYVPPNQYRSLITRGQAVNSHFKDALRKMQTFAGIKPTGLVDKETLELMGRPRCGVKDIIRNRAHR